MPMLYISMQEKLLSSYNYCGEISRSPLFAELSLEFGNWVNEELRCVSVDIKSSHLKRIIFISTISLAEVP